MSGTQHYNFYHWTRSKIILAIQATQLRDKYRRDASEMNLIIGSSKTFYQSYLRQLVNGEHLRSTYPEFCTQEFLSNQLEMSDFEWERDVERLNSLHEAFKEELGRLKSEYKRSTDPPSTPNKI